MPTSNNLEVKKFFGSKQTFLESVLFVSGLFTLIDYNVLTNNLLTFWDRNNNKICRFSSDVWYSVKFSSVHSIIGVDVIKGNNIWEKSFYTA